MSNFQNTKLKRIIRHAGKKARTSVHGITPSAIRGRFIGPRILLNSIPKAGTHLLENALEQFPLLRNAGHRTLTCWDTVSPSTLRLVGSIGRGEFLNGHLTAQPVLFDVIRERSIKVLFVIRDPRDIAVSYYKYVTNIDLTHPMHKYFASLPDDESRLLAAIEKVGGRVTIGELLRRYMPWLDSESVKVCRFEDLIGPSGGGARDRQMMSLRSIASFLEIPMSETRLERVADRTFSTKSSTFRQGKAGNWRGYFKAKHVDAFKKVAGSELTHYGYESDLNW